MLVISGSFLSFANRRVRFFGGGALGKIIRHNMRNE